MSNEKIEGLKIETFAELEKELDELIGSAGGCYDDGIRDAIEYIRMLKKSIKQQIEIIHLSAPYRRPMLEELEKILGDDEGGK